MAGTDDTGDADPGSAGNNPLRSELYAILDDLPGHWVDVDTVVVNHHEDLDPMADYSEYATLREAVKANLEALADRDNVEHDEAWGSDFFRVT